MTLHQYPNPTTDVGSGREAAAAAAAAIGSSSGQCDAEKLSMISNTKESVWPRDQQQQQGGRHTREDIDSMSFAYNEGARVIPNFRDASGVLQALEETLQDVALTDFPSVMLSSSRDPPVPPIAANNSVVNLPATPLSLRFLIFFKQLLQAGYITLYLRLPSLYHSRVLQVCKESGITRSDINCIWSALPSQLTTAKATTIGSDVGGGMSPELSHFLTTWETFVDDLLQEWRTLNIVSALITSATLSLLSLSGDDAVSWTGSILSFICSVIAVLCGYLCILRFSSMRKPHRAAAWSMEARNGNELIWWNPWIMLAAPAAWFSWAVILFLASIMSFTWRASPPTISAGLNTPHAVSPRAALGIRIAISCVLGLGILCIVLTIYTFSTFGDSLDQKFHRRVDSGFRMLGQRRMEIPGIPTFLSGLKDSLGSSIHMPASTSTSFPVSTPQGQHPFESTSDLKAGRRQAFPTIKLMDARRTMPISPLLPSHVEYQGHKHSPWNAFINDLQMVFNHPTHPADAAFACIKHWNNVVLASNGIEAILCLEFPSSATTTTAHEGQTSTSDPIYAVYMMDILQARLDGRQALVDIFGPLPEHLRKIYLIDAIPPSISKSRGHPLGLVIERELENQTASLLDPRVLALGRQRKRSDSSPQDPAGSAVRSVGKDKAGVADTRQRTKKAGSDGEISRVGRR